MTTDGGARSADAERRVLILAPIGRDAELMCRMLEPDGFECVAFKAMPDLAAEARRGTATVIVHEEALGRQATALLEVIQQQPPWSDLPIVVLTREGADSPLVQEAMIKLGNVTLVERPVRVAALRSTVRTAVRARDRQYQTRDYLREREEADQRKDEFLAMLAHELRNPLAPIRNTISILRLSNGKQPASQLWEMMERQVGHMVRLVDDLLEVSRITRGKIELRKDRVELSLVIASAVETSRPLVEAGNHRLSITLPGDSLVVEGDATRLAQVFANLLNNAAKYTDPGGEISLSAAREEGQVVVRVRDNGIGIAAEALPRIFDMFMQAGLPGRNVQPGLGIGLTLAKSLVELHEGSISATSAGPGQGSEFIVRLPLATAPASTTARDAPQASAGQRRRRVLIVDDNRDAADSLGALLQVLGAEVRVVHSGPSALETLERFRPEIAFLDIGMPEMDGYEVARRIRGMQEWRDLRLVALTGWGQERDRRQSKAAGFDHHLIKPADVSALQAVLDAA
ncbi:MAG TPA: ATP-binding protein [Burkholderiales bacterium]|nr:ATP-binding protein [Burkholderiales bacterium]